MLVLMAHLLGLYQFHIFHKVSSSPLSHTLAALLTLSSFSLLYTNTEAHLPSCRTAGYTARPEGKVTGGPSKVQLRTALLSAPILEAGRRAAALPCLADLRKQFGSNSSLGPQREPRIQT